MLQFCAFIVIFWHFMIIYGALWNFLELYDTLWHFLTVWDRQCLEDSDYENLKKMDDTERNRKKQEET